MTGLKPAASSSTSEGLAAPSYDHVYEAADRFGFVHVVPRGRQMGSNRAWDSSRASPDLAYVDAILADLDPERPTMGQALRAVCVSPLLTHRRAAALASPAGGR